MPNTKAEAWSKELIYVASRASVPERGVMWRQLRSEGVQITSSWIDEDGEGQTADFGILWKRITNEIAAASALVLYAEREDFPLKGAIVEAGVALGMGKPVIACLPDLGVLPRNYRPIGSWIAHPLVTRCDNIRAAVSLATRARATPRSDTASLVALREAATLLVLPYEALLLDAESRKWIAPQVWEAIENVVIAVRAALKEEK